MPIDKETKAHTNIGWQSPSWRRPVGSYADAVTRVLGLLNGAFSVARQMQPRAEIEFDMPGNDADETRRQRGHRIAHPVGIGAAIRVGEANYSLSA